VIKSELIILKAIKSKISVDYIVETPVSFSLELKKARIKLTIIYLS